ncbi:hypothetical protein Droror1_Dr00002493 [Drosera rotundifolia]
MVSTRARMGKVLSIGECSRGRGRPPLPTGEGSRGRGCPPLSRGKARVRPEAFAQRPTASAAAVQRSSSQAKGKEVASSSAFQRPTDRVYAMTKEQADIAPDVVQDALLCSLTQIFNQSFSLTADLSVAQPPPMNPNLVLLSFSLLSPFSFLLSPFSPPALSFSHRPPTRFKMARHLSPFRRLLPSLSQFDPRPFPIPSLSCFIDSFFPHCPLSIEHKFAAIAALVNSYWDLEAMQKELRKRGAVGGGSSSSTTQTGGGGCVSCACGCVAVGVWLNKIDEVEWESDEDDRSKVSFQVANVRYEMCLTEFGEVYGFKNEDEKVIPKVFLKTQIHKPWSKMTGIDRHSKLAKST